MDISPYRSRIKEIADHYDQAEADLKTLGNESGKLFIAGINQCRYAGQHLARALRAIDEGDESTVDSDLQASDAHARRAIYDINDAAVRFYLGAINGLKEKYPINWSVVAPNYGEIMEAVAKAREKIDETTENVRRREEAYDQIRPLALALKEAYHKIDVYQPDAARALDERNERVVESQRLALEYARAARRFRIQLTAMIVLGLASLAVGIAVA